MYSVNDAHNPGGIIVDLGQQQGHDAIWVADVKPGMNRSDFANACMIDFAFTLMFCRGLGTLVDFAVRDSTGALAQSADVVVSA